MLQQNFIMKNIGNIFLSATYILFYIITMCKNIRQGADHEKIY